MSGTQSPVLSRLYNSVFIQHTVYTHYTYANMRAYLGPMSIYTMCACDQRCVIMCVWIRCRWSSGIQRPLLKCQSGLSLGRHRRPWFLFSSFLTPLSMPTSQWAEKWSSVVFFVQPSLSLACLLFHSHLQDKRKGCQKKTNNVSGVTNILSSAKYKMLFLSITVSCLLHPHVNILWHLDCTIMQIWSLSFHWYY